MDPNDRATDLGATTPPPRPPDQGMSTLRLDVETLGEMLAYAGGVVALTAAGIRFNSSGALSKTTLVIFLSVAAAALLVFGWIGGDVDDARRRRLRGVFWVLGLGSIVELLAFVTGSIADVGGRAGAVWPTFLGAAVALGLWLLFRGSLQQIGLALLTSGVIVALTFPKVDLLFPLSRPDFTGMALGLFLMGLVWLALAVIGVLTPRRTACVMGTILIVLSPFLLTINHGSAGTILVGAVGVLLVPAGEAIGEGAVAGIGIGAVLLGGGAATRSLVGGSTSSAWVALVLGLAGLIAAIVLLRSKGTPQVPPLPPASSGFETGPGSSV
jgi:hypothetical protein